MHAGAEGLRERAEAIAAFVSGPDDGGICPSCSTMYERPRHEWGVCGDENHVRVFGGPHEVYDYFCPNCGYHFAHWRARDGVTASTSSQ